jgi:hypothetical protein
VGISETAWERKGWAEITGSEQERENKRGMIKRIPWKIPSPPPLLINKFRFVGLPTNLNL